MNIYEKLSAIQKSLIAPKGNYNSFGKFAYRSCEDVLKALKPLCEEHKCVVYITNKLECIGDRNYVIAEVHFVDLESDDKEIVSTAQAREDLEKKGMDGSQITGAASSYARKYALAGMFCIDNEKDADTMDNSEKTMTQDEVNEEAKLRAKVISFINKNDDPAAVKGYIEKTFKCKPTEMDKKMCESFISSMKKAGKEI